MFRALDAPEYQEEAGSCQASRWSGAPERCRWCDAAARPGSTWCSHVCEDDYGANHLWDQARHRAVARDGERCAECGLGPASVSDAKALVGFLIPLSAMDRVRMWRRDLRDLVDAMHAAVALEVNHIVPRLGGGYGHGCHHHQTNLQTLCHRCHVLVTNRQQAERVAEPSRIAG